MRIINPYPIKLAVITFSIIMIYYVYAEEMQTAKNKTSNSCFWINVGVGACYFGLSFNTSFSYSYKENVFTLKYLEGEELQFSPGGYEFEEPSLSFKEKGILYGRSYRQEFIGFSLSGGIGYLNAINRGKQIKYKEYEELHIATYGLLFEAKFRIEILPIFGVGASYFGNINKEKTFTGGMIELYIGQLRE